MKLTSLPPHPSPPSAIFQNFPKKPHRLVNAGQKYGGQGIIEAAAEMRLKIEINVF